MLLVLSLITAGSYAYFIASVNGNNNAFETVILSGDMKLSFSDGESVYLDNAYPTLSVTKIFAISNTGSVDTIYDVYFSEIINNFVDKNDLVYKIEDVTETGLSSVPGCTSLTEKVVPSTVGEESKMISSCPIGKNQTHVYALTISFKDDNTNQDDNKGRKFRSTISVNEYKKYGEAAELISGKDFNDTAKTLAKNSLIEYTNTTLRDYCEANPQMAEDNNMTCDQFIEESINNYSQSDLLIIDDMIVTSSLPNDIETVSVSSANSDYDVRMWVKDRTLYLYSDVGVINFNSDSSEMFRDISGTMNLDLTSFNSSKVTNMSNMFDNSNITGITFGNGFNTSEVTSMKYMFNNTNYITSLDLSCFNTSSVSNMTYMFANMGSLQSINLGNSFNTSAVNDMSYMFYKDNSLTVLDLGENFDTSNVTTFYYTFFGMSKLTDINLGNKFDTSKVTLTKYMFGNDTSLTTIDFGPLLSFENLKTMSYMFSNCTNLTTIYTPAGVDGSGVRDKTSVFEKDSKLVGGAGTTFSSSNKSGIYARIDDPDNEKPGYFTLRSE